MPSAGVLIAAAGAPWEAAALTALGSGGVVVLKRCVDLTDLLATAGNGQAGTAVVSAELPGLDHDAVVRLLREDVRTIAVGAADLTTIGVARMLGVAEIDRLPGTVLELVADELVEDPDVDTDPVAPATGADGRVVAVFGAAGAPGRTTVATALASLRGVLTPTVLVDADPYGGAVAQQLGVLDEASGLLAAARLVNSGAMGAESFARCRRRITDRFEVLTGLPRPDRWVEVRTGVLDSVLEHAAGVGDVVVDCGFCLEDDADYGRTVSRNQLTLDAVGAAAEIVVVGSAEPVGLARLARALVELGEVTPAPVRVVVNRMRDSLGWTQRDITGMVEGYVQPLGVHFVPEDRATVDRALVAGKALTELGDTHLRRALALVAEAVFGPNG